MVEQRTSYRLARRLATFLKQRLKQADQPLFVAIDGRSGTGKSTIAQLAAAELGHDANGEPVVVILEGDHFYSGGSAEAWDARSVEEKVERVIDWRRQRVLLETLRKHGEAYWQPFDWNSEGWDADGSQLVAAQLHCTALPIVMVEGVYSARPQLVDLFDLRILIKAPRPIRHTRIKRREGEAYQDDWYKRWVAAEAYYFTHIVQEETYDLVLVADDTEPV